MLGILLLGALVWSSNGCYKDKAEPGDCGTTVSYSQEIVPIINSSCVTGQGAGTGCHDAWIHDYSQVKSKIKGGSWQYRVLDLKDMPLIPNNFGIDPLTDEELKLMQCWIEQGFKKN
ncbi:MAG: hypothetical protein MI810_17765 [Flavobacteriales bacterium]|nr:hypothetical protein [Flavobacteriales bacterium]